MITKFKIYEDFFDDITEGVYMIYKKMPYMIIQLKKVGINPKQVNWIIRNHNKAGKKYILLVKKNDGNINFVGTINDENDIISGKDVDYYKRKGLWKGKVEVTIEDINKYNLEKEANKYNI